MPGKQMAIDADLNAGLITQDEARARRAEVRAEADFYGSMDGASKFVRGDAIAGILILVINIIGGLAIGTMGHDLSFGDAGRDLHAADDRRRPRRADPGAAALDRGRDHRHAHVARRRTWAASSRKQLFGQPRALGDRGGAARRDGPDPRHAERRVPAAGGARAAGGAWMLREAGRSQPADAGRELRRRRAAAPPPEMRELSWDDVQPVDLIGLEVGYRLVPLVDKNQGGDLLARIRGVRRKLYAGARLPRAGRAHPRQPGAAAERLSHQSRRRAGGRGRDLSRARARDQSGPRVRQARRASRRAIRRSAWKRCGSSRRAREHAQTLGYTVVDASTVIATHLSHVVQTHAHELLGHEEVQQLLNALAQERAEAGRGSDAEACCRSASVVRVLQGLLAERVPITQHAHDRRDAGGARAAHAGPGSAAGAGARRARPPDRPGHRRHRRRAARHHARARPRATAARTRSEARATARRPGLEPGSGRALATAARRVSQRQEMSGEPAVLLVPPQLRSTLARFMRAAVPGMHVLAWNEIPDNRKVRSGDGGWEIRWNEDQTLRAKDMRQALRQVRDAQGPDAVILSSRRISGGVEVVAAVDYDVDVELSVRATSRRAPDAHPDR